MKKKYVKPEIEVHKIEINQPLLAGSNPNSVFFDYNVDDDDEYEGNVY